MRLAPALLLVAALVTGCELFVPRDGAYPQACAGLGFSEVQCRAIVARATQQAGLRPGDVVSARFLANKADGQLGSSQPIAVVGLTQKGGGQERIEEIRCVGISSSDDRVCVKDPQIGIGGGIDRDVPCAGEAPEGCATPPPTPRPASERAAQQLAIRALDIPLDHTGSYEVAVGEASLPDGYMTERSASLADTRPTTFWIQGGIFIDVRPLVAGRPPVGSRYRDLYDGVEPVQVFLVFEVTETSPGAVLEVRDLVVR